MDKFLCIYHGHCADGFGAAWVVRQYFDERNVEFFPGRYQEPPPDVAGRRVLMVDFSYKRPVLLEMAEKAESILILDHHKSAQADLVDLPSNVEAHFDMERSGAMMTWDHYFPDHTAPNLIITIQDRDLWRFRFPHTKAVQACLFSHPYDFEIWDELMKAPLSELARDGEAIARKHSKDVREMIESLAYRSEIAGHDVPVLNCPYFYSSEAGHIMAEGEKFAACYWDGPDHRTYSLRSNEAGLDVSKIAEQFGGGGHRNAAGYKIPR